MTYTDDHALRRRAELVRAICGTRGGFNAAAALADQIVALERELDQRRHQVQVLFGLEDIARELGFEDPLSALEAFEAMRAEQSAAAASEANTPDPGASSSGSLGRFARSEQ
jgi:hypothetical protein